MSDSEGELRSCTPPELRQAAEKVGENLLPHKSRGRYEKAYKAFKDWCACKEVFNIDSENVVLAYFSELTKDKKASTLWSIYSMLRTTLNIRDNVDISKFSKLGAYLKQQNIGYKAKKSSVFTEQDIDKFLNVGVLEFLPQKVKLVI